MSNIHPLNLLELSSSIVAFFIALLFSLTLTPLARFVAIRLNILDHPISSIKTHKEPVPYLGGMAILASFIIAMVIMRFLTSFPSGTLRSLRGILAGAVIMSLLGLIDDAKKFGLHYRIKFLFQVAAACLVTVFGIRIKFIQPEWFAYVISIIWIVGVTNAFNLIDIMDGLASGVAIVVTIAFVFIALPTEEMYVNLAAASLCGAALGFFPYNLSKRFRLFMGDSGSLLLGFVCSSLALGTSYGKQTEWGVFAPLLILCLPIFDTLFVFSVRILRGASPFLGSKDHFALRLEQLGWSRPFILLFSLSFTAILCVAAYAITRVSSDVGASIYVATIFLIGFFVVYILRVRVH